MTYVDVAGSELHYNFFFFLCSILYLFKQTSGKQSFDEVKQRYHAVYEARSVFFLPLFSYTDKPHWWIDQPEPNFITICFFLILCDLLQNKL